MEHHGFHSEASLRIRSLLGSAPVLCENKTQDHGRTNSGVFSMSPAPTTPDYFGWMDQLRRASARRGFIIHATVFVLTMTGLFLINALGKGGWWVQWPLLGWGLGLAGHGALVYRTLNRPRPGATGEQGAAAGEPPKTAEGS
jgi:hypothetical protein